MEVAVEDSIALEPSLEMDTFLAQAWTLERVHAQSLLRNGSVGSVVVEFDEENAIYLHEYWSGENLFPRVEEVFGTPDSVRIFEDTFTYSRRGTDPAKYWVRRRVENGVEQYHSITVIEETTNGVLLFQNECSNEEALRGEDIGTFQVLRISFGGQVYLDVARYGNALFQSVLTTRTSSTAKRAREAGLLHSESKIVSYLRINRRGHVLLSKLRKGGNAATPQQPTSSFPQPFLSNLRDFWKCLPSETDASYDYFMDSLVDFVSNASLCKELFNCECWDSLEDVLEDIDDSDVRKAVALFFS